MKIKTFILTFLMMMSSPFLFGQHWEDPGNLGYQNSMTVYAQVMLDNVVQTKDYQVAAFHGDQLLAVSEIIPFQGTTSNYHVHLQIYGDNSMGNIYFKFFNGTKEYVSETEFPFEVNVNIGDHPNYSTIHFYSVAQIGDVVYPSLQEAIDAAANGDVVTLLKDNAENVTVVQAPDVAFTIDGAHKKMSGTITVNGKSAAYATAGLTIKNVNFNTTNIADASIMLGVSGDNNTRYTNGVTVQDCNFTGDGQTKVAIRNYTGGCKNLTVTGGTFTDLHSLMQVKGVGGLTVSGVTVSDCKNGVSVGTSTNVAISSSQITATGYGVRADGTGTYEMTLTDNTISAELPVVVRNATGDYKLEVDGGSYAATNAEGYHVVFTNGDDGTYEAPTGVFQLTIAEGTDLNVFPVYVAKIGTKGYQTLDEAFAAVGDGDVVIELLADVTFDYNARDAYGTTGTTSLTINGNGKTLTLNQKDSDWASFGLANADAKVVFNNMTIEKTGYGDTSGAWNTHAIIFSSEVEMNDVIVNNSMAVQAGATLNNVTINEANGYYGLWINGNGQSVTMTGGSITATNGGRGIKIADQYIDAPALVTLNVTGITFKTAKKAAVLVSSTAGAAIAASNVNIENVAEDNENFAWVDEDWATHYGKVTVTGGVLGQENLPVFAAALMNGEKVDGYYKTLPEAVAAAQDGNTITMLQNDNVTETVKVNNNITIDLNGKTVTANCKKAFEVHANATIKNGTINSQSRCVDTRTNVELTLTSVNLNAPEYKVENQQPLTIGGSDNGTKVTMTNVNIDAGTQGYAIISFVETNLTATNSNISGYSALYVKPGSEGSNFSFVNSTLKSDISTNDVEGNSFATIATEADDVTVTLDAESKLEADGQNQFAMVLRAEENNITVAGDITATNFLSGNVNNNTIKVKAGYSEDLLAEGYVTSEADANGLVQVSGLAVAKIGETYYATLDAAFKAAQNGNEVKILAAGTYALSTSGKNITVTGAVDGVIFDNIGAKNMGGANVTFNNVTFDYYPNVNYTGLQHSGNLVYNDCTFEGQPFLYGTSETFNNCTFNQNSADAYNVWTYGAKEVVFNECTFNSAGKSVLIYSDQAGQVNDVKVVNCQLNASNQVAGKAAFEMDSSLQSDITLTIDAATTATGFDNGNVSGNSLWNNKKGNETEANNDITVVVNDETVLAPLPLVAMTADDKNHRFTSLQAAVNAADATNNTITLINNVQLNAYVTINKSVTLDLGEYNITRENGTALYVNGESIEVTIDGEGTVSGTQAVYVDNGTVAIDGGNYVGNFEAVYVKGTGHVVINDGTFSGENENKNFILNEYDATRATTDITVKGGTFVGFNPQNNAAEGANTDFCDANYAATETETGVWAVLPAVAKIGETRFATLQDAVNAADATNNTITLIKDVQLDAYVTINKSVTLNLGQFNITRVDGTALYFNGEGIEVTIDGEGTVSGTQAVYVDNGTVTIDGGNYVGHHAVYVINNGHAVIKDGTFKLKEGADPNFLLNEYDATRDVTTIAVKGGTFVGFNPQNNAAEGANTNFCAEGYAATETETGVWAVLPVVAKIGEATYATVQDAINVATATDVIDVVGTTTEENITIADNADITLTFAENVTLNGYFAPFEGNLTINGGTINNTNSGFSAIEITSGELNLNGVNIASARHAVRIDGAVTATIDGGEYTLTATSGTRHAVNVSGGAEVTIKAGTFVGPKGTTMDSGSAVCVQAGAKVTIEGGDFSNGKNATLGVTGTMIVTGGTFDQDPSAYVNTPYVVIKKSDNEYNVIKGVAKIGETYYASLQEAIGNVANGETINLLVACAENVSIVQTEGVSFTIDGKIAENTKVQYTGTISIDGNGGYDRAETLTIKNIKFYNNVSNYGLTFINAKTNTQSHNVTIADCDFVEDYTVGNNYAKGITVSEGNNWTVTGCTVNAKFNIFIDYSGAYNKMMNKNLLVDGCTINANRGVLLGRFSDGCKIANTKFDCATLGINVESHANSTADQVLSHTLEDVEFTGKAINCSYSPEAPAHTHIFNIVGEVTSASELSFPDPTNAAGRLNFVLTATDATLQAKGQDYLTVNVSEELAAQHYKVVYDVDTYKAVKEKNVKNTTKDGEPTYPTLDEAITAASAGDELLLLNNITEDVTISKNLTIDGGYKNYTGTMTGNVGLTVTVQNLNFVNAGFVKSAKSTTGTYTFKNCTFDGSDNYPYAFSVRGAKTITIKDCTVKDYLYSFLYVTSSTTTVEIEDVTVEDCPSYGVYFSSGVTNTSIENLTVKNSGSGFVINNTANRTFNLKGCKLEGVATAINHAGNGTNTVTCNLLGENDFGTSALSEYAKVVLTAADATLTAQENLNVTTSVEGSIVKYEEGKYVVKGAIAKIGDEIYASLQEAINAAVDNDVIEVLQDINLADVELQTLDGSYNTYFKVEGKAVTIDLNGKTISGEYAITSPMLVGVFSTDNNGHLTLTGNGTVDVTAKTTVYSLVVCYEDGCTITIENGTYTLDKASDNLIYYGGKTDAAVTVKGGTFTLGNVNTGENGKPWIFNVLGAGDHHVYVTGGTFNFDINRQHWSNEAVVAETHYTVNNGDGTYTVKDGAEAYVNTGMTTGPYFAPKNIGYATLEEALAKAQEFVDPNVTLLQVVELAETLTIEADKEIILDLNGKTITGKDNNTSGSFNLFVNKGTFEVKDGSAEGTGKITLEATTNRYWNASSSIVSNSAGTLTITSGTLEHLGGTDMAYGIDNNSTLGLTTLNVDGGKIASPYRAIRQFQNSLQDNVVVINGGTISARAGIWMQQPSTNDKAQLGTLEVNGGNFECIANAIVIDIQGSAKSNVTINGGTFSNTSETANLLLIWPFSNMNVVNDNCSAVMNITGGNFTCTGEGNLIGILDGADTNGDVVLTGGIYSEDVNAYCAEGFAAVNNGDGSWTVMPVQEQSLVKGWNWYSSYLNITTENLLGALGTNGKSIVQNSTWSATYYGVNDGTDYGWGYESHTFDVSKMYMIETSQACELALSGNLVDASEITITLNPGWNWIGYPSNVEVRLEDALDGLQPSHGDEIKTQGAFASYYDYEGQSMWLTYSFGNGNMKPTKGYMYNNTSGETKTFTYNIAPATTRGNNETEVATHYSVDYTKYPFNMTMTAVVDGAIGDNYEVAALVNGEVRGSTRPVYVEVLDAYMLFLTISGDNVEEVSFKYYDLTTGEEYDLVNRIDYSNNAMVGSVNEPYVLSRGTTGIGDAAMSQVNIYPNPTTTGTEINLEAVCDTVEVFNALGVKVAEYQNVDSIDALETAGIYVIRITNDGNVQNCRLVVK